jgi:hypothetical protein
MKQKRKMTLLTTAVVERLLAYRYKLEAVWVSPTNAYDNIYSGFIVVASKRYRNGEKHICVDLLDTRPIVFESLHEGTPLTLELKHIKKLVNDVYAQFRKDTI